MANCGLILERKKGSSNVFRPSHNALGLIPLFPSMVHHTYKRSDGFSCHLAHLASTIAYISERRYDSSITFGSQVPSYDNNDGALMHIPISLLITRPLPGSNFGRCLV